MEKIPLIVDVDTGTDDAIAITAALLCQEIFDIRGFTTVMGNVEIEKTSKNTLNLVRHLGWNHKIAVGAARPLVQDYTLAISHGKTGLGDVTLPEAPVAFYEKEACETIYEEALAMNGNLQILAVGPETNIALAIQRHPDIVKLIKQITVMGGGLYGGNMTMTSEFNIYNDPEAAKIVFDSGIPLYMVGLDVTLKPQLPRWVFDRVQAAKNPYAEFAGKIFDFMYRRKIEIGGDDPNLHDVIALCSIVRPDILTFKKFFMTVECKGDITRGMTVADFNNVMQKDSNVYAAIDINIDAFWNWLTTILENPK
jgi:inosine-uridine nucleoside N-ribohydrolase